jgi:serine/threonine kinase PknH
MTGDPGNRRAGSQLGPYRIHRLLGRGGFGDVYEAEDTVHGRLVALKVSAEGLAQDPHYRHRLRSATHVASRLQDPHIVRIDDCGEIDGVFFIAMQLVDGLDLHTLVSRDQRLRPERAVAIVEQVAAALDAAHRVGLMHRDVKPQNILVCSDDSAYLTDFGLASAAIGPGFGTRSFPYSAPETFQTEGTYRSDIYALAGVLYECLTGAQPYPAGSLEALIGAHLTSPPPRPSALLPNLPAAFDDVIARGMAKAPLNRYATAGELAAAARDALRDDTGPLGTFSASVTGVGAIPTAAPMAASPPGASFQSLGGWEVSPVGAEKFRCPFGDYEWYRQEVGMPIPWCPTHSLPLQLVGMPSNPPGPQRGWRRWLRRAPRV